MYYRCWNYLITTFDGFLGFQTKLKQRIQTFIKYLVNEKSRFQRFYARRFS
jgi:uncharacterized protein YfbU (UPF0304 family)